MAGRQFAIWHGSEPVDHKSVRRKCRMLLKMLIEPEPKYRTGKFWND